VLQKHITQECINEHYVLHYVRHANLFTQFNLPSLYCMSGITKKTVSNFFITDWLLSYVFQLNSLKSNHERHMVMSGDKVMIVKKKCWYIL
jgi:hypothetical protein